MDVLKLGVFPAVLYGKGKGDEIPTQLYYYIEIPGLAIHHETWDPYQITRIQWTSKIDFSFTWLI